MSALDRRKVTMVSLAAGADGSVIRHEATDYVAVADLDVYVADAQTRWQSVVVSEEPESGPGGDDGAYDVTAATTSPED